MVIVSPRVGREAAPLTLLQGQGSFPLTSLPAHPLPLLHPQKATTTSVGWGVVTVFSEGLKDEVVETTIYDKDNDDDNENENEDDDDNNEERRRRERRER